MHCVRSKEVRGENGDRGSLVLFRVASNMEMQGAFGMYQIEEGTRTTRLEPHSSQERIKNRRKRGEKRGVPLLSFCGKSLNRHSI